MNNLVQGSSYKFLRYFIFQGQYGRRGNPRRMVWDVWPPYMPWRRRIFVSTYMYDVSWLWGKNYALGTRSRERAYWFHFVLRPASLSSSLYLFFSKSLPLLFQSVDREVNKNTQWKFWNFLTTFKVFRPKNWKIVKNFKIELVPQFCLDPKDT